MRSLRWNNCPRSILVQGVDRYARANSSDGEVRIILPTRTFESRSRWTNDSKNPKTRNRWTNSSTEPLGWCACATERITPRNDSFFSSLIKDPFQKWMNRSRPTPSLATSARAAKESGSYLYASYCYTNGCSLHCICVSVFVVLLPSVFHTNDMFALSEKSAEKKTKTGRLPDSRIYKQKPAGSDLWPVNRCIPIKKS